MTPRLELTNATLRYGELTAVDNLTVTLDGGKIYGLLGRNGSGKTSLLSVIAAFRKATSGEIRLDGQPVFENPAAMRNICLIRDVVDTVDGDEKVKTALEFAADVRPHWDQTYADHLVERFQLPMRQRVDKLSRGQRSALGIVLGLASRAPLTMFDESYLGLDAPARLAFYDEVLEDFMRHPRTLIISTHLIEEVSSLFEEVLIIDQGRLLIHDNAETLRSQGVAVTGRADVVGAFVAGRTVLNTKQLGHTKSAMLYGRLDDQSRADARAAGLDLDPIALQELFVHLTDTKNGGAS